VELEHELRKGSPIARRCRLADSVRALRFAKRRAPFADADARTDFDLWPSPTTRSSAYLCPHLLHAFYKFLARKAPMKIKCDTKSRNVNFS
jgi:hypothetical protein